MKVSLLVVLVLTLAGSSIKANLTQQVQLTAVTVNTHEKEVPKEIRSKLFKQVLTDFGDIKDCIEKEEGGTRKAEEDMNVEAVDVNRDGVPEYEVELSGSCSCGMELHDLSLSPERWR